jgi:hypothetical protein
MARETSLDLGWIEDIANHGFPDKVKHDMIARMRGQMQRRIREGFTVKMQKINENSEVWKIIKHRAGFAHTEPLQMTGDMTQPSAWTIKISGDEFRLELKGEHHEKWDTIHGIAEKTGKNWDDAWGFGDLETREGLDELFNYIFQIGGEIHVSGLAD